MKITPAHGRILVRLATEETTASPCKVKVVAVGASKPSRKTARFRVKVGDDVLIGKRAGVPITFARHKYSVIRVADIVGLINPDAKT